MKKCCICDKMFGGDGHDPMPIGNPENNTPCCDYCFEHFVQKAKMLENEYISVVPDIGSTVVIFYAKGFSSPIDTMVQKHQFLAGKITEISEDANGNLKAVGDWGFGQLDLTNDSYVVYEKK